MSGGPAPHPGLRASDPDRTPRRLRTRPLVYGVGAVALLAAGLAAATRSGATAMLALALAGLIAFDALGARGALRRAEVRVTNPVDAVAGEPSTHVVQASGLSAPVELVPPGWWSTRLRPSVVLRSSEPGAVVLEAPARGVATHLAFDLVATGPLGLAEAAVRVRVWLPVPWHVGPAPLPHDPVWPLLRTVPPGESSTVTRGDDLFRGVRPYTRGDPRRSVHWPATAHRGTLMVKERDGIEQVALRVVLELPEPGPEAEQAAGRAAWLVEHGLARGWRVHLVTAEATPAPPRPLLRPWGPMPPPAPMGTATRTVERQVEQAAQARRQLAAAGVGTPATGPTTGMTRVVSPWGDRWA